MTADDTTPTPDHEAAHQDEHELASLREAFRERRISLVGMDRPLRLATGAAMGCMIGAAALTALRDVGTSSVVLGVTDGVRTTLSTPLFVGALVFLCIGLGYLLTGLAFAKPVIAATSILLLTAIVGYETGVLPIGHWRAVLPSWGTTVTRALLAGVVAVTAAVLAWRRGRHGDHASDRVLRGLALLVFTALVGGYLWTLRAASPTVDGLSNFPPTVDLLMVDVALLATPMLQIAAVDFAEWGSLTAERLHHARWPQAVRRWIVPSACSVGLIVIGCVRRGSVGSIAHAAWQAGLLLVAALAVVLLVGRALRVDRATWPHNANVATLFVVTALAMWVITPLVGLATGALTVHPTPTVNDRGEYTAAANVRSVRTHDGATLLLPAGWQTTQAGTLDGFSGVDADGNSVRLVVVGYPAPIPIGAVASGLQLSAAGSSHADGEFTELEATTAAGAPARLWVVPTAGGGEYVLYGLFSGPEAEQAGRELAALVHSFRLPGTTPAAIPAESESETPAEAEQASTDRLIALGAAASLVLSVIWLVALRVAGRRWAPQVRLTGLAFSMVTLFTLLYFGDSVARTLSGAHTAWPVLTRDGTLIGIGALGLIALVVTEVVDAARRPWARRLPAALTMLTGGTLALVGIEELYNRALSASRIAVWAGIIVLIAVAWDVTMSGESLTNHASRLWPRSTRLFAFFGYTVIVGATVLYYGGQRSAGSGQAVEAFFEPDAVTQNALFRLGLPVLALMFLLRLFGTTAGHLHEPGSHGPDGQSAAEPGSAESTPAENAGVSAEPALALD